MCVLADQSKYGGEGESLLAALLVSSVQTF